MHARGCWVRQRWGVISCVCWERRHQGQTHGRREWLLEASSDLNIPCFCSAGDKTAEMTLFPTLGSAGRQEAAGDPSQLGGGGHARSARLLSIPLFALGKPKDSPSPPRWGRGGCVCGRVPHRLFPGCSMTAEAPVPQTGAPHSHQPNSASPPTFIAPVKPNNE